MYKILLLLLPLILFCEDSFLTTHEYGEMLYKNPRGIGCNNCHGESGEGQIIAKYKHKKRERELKAPQINHLGYSEFSIAFNNVKKSDIMPKYFLTQKEIQILYLFLKNKIKKYNTP